MSDTDIPGTPDGHRRAYGAIAETLAFGREIEDVGHKHLRNGFLVFSDILRSVQPADTRPGRRLHFADDHGKSVDQQYDVQPFSTVDIRIDPLIRNNIFILRIVVIIKEAYADRTPVRRKGERVLLKNELFKALILCHQIVRLYGTDQGAKLV